MTNVDFIMKNVQFRVLGALGALQLAGNAAVLFHADHGCILSFVTMEFVLEMNFVLTMMSLAFKMMKLKARGAWRLVEVHKLG